MSPPVEPHASRTGLTPGLVLVLAFVALLVLVPATVVAPGPLRSNGSPAVLLSLVLGGLVVLGYAVGTKAPSLHTGGVMSLLVAGAMLVAVWAQGQLVALAPDVQASATRAVLRVAGYTAVGLAVMWVARDRRQRFVLVVVLVAALCYAAVVGILQARTGVDGRYWLQPPGFVLNRDFQPAGRAGYTRALGTSDSPIEFSALMSVLLALSLMVVRLARSTVPRVVGGLGLVLAPIALLDSLSRTAVLTALTVLVVYLLTFSLRAIVTSAVLVAAVVAALYVLDSARFDAVVDLVVGAGSDSSVTSRTDDYTYVSQTFRDSPLLGLGLGTQLPAATRFIDNHWAQAVLQGGIVGVAAYALQFLAAIVATLGPYRSRRDKTESVAYLAVVAVVLVGCFTFDLFAFNQVRLIFFVVFGLAWAAQLQARREGGPTPVADRPTPRTRKTVSAP